MLALKELRILNIEPSKLCLLDLPDELLDGVIHFLYTDNGRFTRDVVPVSATCSRLRKAAVPILFDTLHVRIKWSSVDRRTFNILLNLDLAPHTFARHVRHIKQDDSPNPVDQGGEDLKLCNELVTKVVARGLRSLINVRTLRYVILSGPKMPFRTVLTIKIVSAALAALCLHYCHRHFPGVRLSSSWNPAPAPDTVTSKTQLRLTSIEALCSINLHARRVHT